jgi:ketosteroid isomerase-like protein
MSHENVEIVRQHMDAFRSGNYAAALATYHPDAVYDATVRPGVASTEAVTESWRRLGSGLDPGTT